MCRRELEEVLKQEDKFIDDYARWVISLEQRTPGRGYFGKAINKFSDFALNSGLPPMEILKEFKKQLDEGRDLD